MTEEKKNKKIKEKCYDWFDERFQVGDLLAFAAKKEVPDYRSTYIYYFGGVALFLFVVQVLTGFMLLLYYQPGADSAYESVHYIVTQVKFGWLIRALHSWSANLMVLFVFIHMFTVYFSLSFRKPREFTWLTGLGLLGLLMMFGFSGYLLPWNELAYFATRVGTGMAGAVPVIGDFILQVMRGGEEVTGATISRFFGLHVAVLPLVFGGLLAMHLFFIQKQGMSEPVIWEQKKMRKRYIKFVPNFMLRDFMMWLIVLDVLILLAVFFPDGIGVVHWPLGVKADAFAPPPAVIKPEWYFIFTFQFLKFLPAHIGPLEGELFGLIALNLGGMLWGLVPFISSKPHEGKKRFVFQLFGILVLLFIIIMTILGYVLE
ncbi:MAG: cytochrome b N-terminal domain-containing protein [bacterium]|nr:cytochrome b N-terminal domain-containing protein [bacterium]MBU1918798.1 cytochrome b N-terminal domain-containing protein [bacterium]